MIPATSRIAARNKHTLSHNARFIVPGDSESMSRVLATDADGRRQHARPNLFQPDQADSRQCLPPDKPRPHPGR
jgi:hypothetical protein